MRLSQLNKFIGEFDTKNSLLQSSYSNNRTEIIISNIQNFKKFLEYIHALEFYKDEISFLYQSSLYKTANDQLSLQPTNAIKIQNSSKYLLDSYNALSITLPNLVPNQNEYAIDIKLPIPTDFDSLNATLSILQKTISQVIINDKIKGFVNVNHWEYGSFWIELILGTQAAVSLVAGISWSAAVISKKRVEVKIFEEQARAMKLKNDSLDDILSAQKNLVNNLINDEAIGLLSKHFNNNDNEQRERIKYAIKEFATLIQDGAEIHPSLMSPEKVQNLFPNYKQLDSIESQVTKQIEDKS